MTDNLFNLIIDEPIYYAYYTERTGAILSVTNEIHPVHLTAIELSYEMFENFITGKYKFSDYYVGIDTTSAEGVTSKLTILSMQDNAQLGNAIYLRRISDPATIDTEFIVTWDNIGGKWLFSASAAGKKRLLSKVAPAIIKLCVVLQDDFDFLIRIIEVSSTELMNSSTVERQFTSKYEEDITKISISTKIFFESYGININE